jgi:hypothetical protein
MQKILFSVLCLIVMFSCKSIHADGNYWILSLGFTHPATDAAREGISGKWKIKYFNVEDCVVTQKVMDSIDVENQRTYDALEREYGTDWMVQYNKDIEGFTMKRMEVMDVLITNTVFREELKKHYIAIDGVDQDVKELKAGLYEVVVYNNALKAENKECFSMRVNTKNRTVNLIK